VAVDAVVMVVEGATAADAGTAGNGAGATKPTISRRLGRRPGT